MLQLDPLTNRLFGKTHPIRKGKLVILLKLNVQSCCLVKVVWTNLSYYKSYMGNLSRKKVNSMLALDIHVYLKKSPFGYFFEKRGWS